jgi:hypothetical protein
MIVAVVTIMAVVYVPDIVALYSWSWVNRMWRSIGMNVCLPVSPGAHPGAPVDDDVVLSPGKARTAPAPGRKERADRDGWSKVNRSSNKEAGSWPYIYDGGIIDRNIDDSGIHGSDFNIAGIRRYPNVLIAS